ADGNAGTGAAGVGMAMRGQLLELVKAQPGSEQARAAQSLLDATKDGTKAARGAGGGPLTQRVAKVTAKVQRAQVSFDKTRAQQVRLSLEPEKCKCSLSEAATALALAEKERAEVIQKVVPPAKGQEAPPTGTGIDLSSLPGGSEPTESMFTLNLGPAFDNSGGVMDAADLEELERRKKLVMGALLETLKTTFGGMQDKLREHCEPFSNMKEKIAKNDATRRPRLHLQ
ncbi:unnamed protein product, partial [Prorocentrum cordatum]